jgi:hypothetical protein
MQKIFLNHIPWDAQFEGSFNKILPLNWASQGIRTEKENRQSAYLTSKKQVRNTHTHTHTERERGKKNAYEVCDNVVALIKSC